MKTKFLHGLYSNPCLQVSIQLGFLLYRTSVMDCDWHTEAKQTPKETFGQSHLYQSNRKQIRTDVIYILNKIG